jgi:hypothetical protein
MKMSRVYYIRSKSELMTLKTSIITKFTFCKEQVMKS